MERHALEAWALRILRAVDDKSPIEDSFVELKREWPTNHARSAKQLAALANAARGSPVLWLIGADEQHGVVGADDVELANWWPQVARWFDPPAPAMQNIVVFWKRTPVAALSFDTTARPFVTKEQGGSSEFLVPWREGNRTRAANRAELIEMLSPLVKLPHLEILSLQLRADRPSRNSQRWSADLDAYVHQDIHSSVVFPVHRCSAVAHVPDYGMVVPLNDLFFRTQAGRQMADASVRGPGRLSLRLNGHLPHNPGIAFPSHAPAEQAHVRITLLPANSNTPLVIDESLNPKPHKHALGLWKFGLGE